MIAFITGGSKGIGRALCMQFAKNGFDIISCARNETELNELKNQIIENYNVNCYFYVCDVSVKQQVLSLSEELLKNFKNIDVLVNNAGVFIPGSIAVEDDDTFEKMINTNIASAYYFTKKLLPIINQGAYIFNICSTASFTPYINGGSYCISKFALLGFSKVLREELKEKNIAVSAVMPGATYTNSWKGTTLPIERFMQSSDIANMIWQAYMLKDSMVLDEIVMRPMKGDL